MLLKWHLPLFRTLPLILSFILGVPVSMYRPFGWLQYTNRLYLLPETNVASENQCWKMKFLLGGPIFGGYVFCRECKWLIFLKNIYIYIYREHVHHFRLYSEMMHPNIWPMSWATFLYRCLWNVILSLNILPMSPEYGKQLLSQGMNILTLI